MLRINVRKSQLETFCQGTDLHSRRESEPRVNAAIPRDVKELLVVTSGFPGRDCTVAPSAPSLHPFRPPHVISRECLHSTNA